MSYDGAVDWAAINAVGRTLLAVLAAAAGVGAVRWLGERGPTSLMVGVAVLSATPSGAKLRAAFNRPLVGGERAAALIGLAGLLAVAGTWLVVPVWRASPALEVARVGALSWHVGNHVPWCDVCWPALLVEQALLLVIAGGLIAWVLRRDRSRRSVSVDESFCQAC